MTPTVTTPGPETAVRRAAGPPWAASVSPPRHGGSRTSIRDDIRRPAGCRPYRTVVVTREYVPVTVSGAGRAVCRPGSVIVRCQAQIVESSLSGAVVPGCRSRALALWGCFRDGAKADQCVVVGRGGVS